MPDIAERELNNVTWIIDYNRQNLDGNRIKNENGLARTDAERIEALALANGWNVIHARHGFKREQLFQEIGEELRAVFESFSDFETQALLVTQDNLALKNRCLEIEPALKKKFEKFPEDKLCQKLREAFEDFGGHDIALLIEILEKCKTSNRPSLIIAHTIKGWGIKSLAARPGNHSMLPEEDEVLELLKAEGLDFNDPFNLKFNDEKVESYLKERAKFLEEGRQKQRELKKKNESLVKQKFIDQDGLPLSFDINLKLSPYANTQWMWGQLASKLIRIATTDESKLSESEKKWKLVSAHIATLAPDVGTSTNMNPSMDSKVYAPGAEIEDYELKYNVKDTRRPNLVPLERQDHRHIRFEIEEANSMSCLGAFGKMKDHLGVYLLPFMTIYDFFIKRALDQYFYNLYWGSSFILVGTPSGVTLSPEGAQHCWKSDFQIPNQITWEPAFAIEMDWIVRDAIERHFTDNNKERTGVLIRAVTRGIEQKLFFENLKNQKRFENLSEKEILEKTKQDCLEGGYWLILHEGKEDYAPGDNVIHLFVMGALVQEACEASKKLYEEHGIYANVLVVTSPDLLLGNLGRKNNYKHLKEGLNVKGDLYLTRSKTISKGNTTEILDNIELISMKASRVPILGICDGEPGFLDNSGSIVGVQSDTLALRKHSKSGTPKDVYRYHGLDAESIANSALKLLTESCFDEVLINSKLLN
jgi:pyruvate dehydrogenase E1 component